MDVQVQMVPLAQITPAKDNPRQHVGDVDDLAASIKTAGLLEPLVVTSGNGKGGYLLVCGARRLAAAKKAGLAEAPCLIRAFTEEERIEAMVIENLHREDLSPIEEASGYRRLEELGLTQRTIAVRVHRSQAHVSKRLALLTLPAPVRKEVDSGGIAVGDAVELAKIADDPARVKAALSEGKRFYGGNLSTAIRRQVEARDQERKRADAIEQLRKTGVRLVKNGEVDHYGDPAGMKPLGGWDGIAITPAKHAAEPCHLAGVTPSGEVRYFCDQPARHASKDAAARRATEQQRRQAKRAAHEKGLREARKTRRELVVKLLAKGAVPRREAIGQLTAGLSVAATAESRKEACALLGVEPVKRQHQGWSTTDAEQPLRDYAAKGDHACLQVGLALAFAEHEEQLRSTWSAWKDNPTKKQWLDFLQRQGYTLSEAETLELAGKAPTR